jgi:hypothetical protein
MGSRHIDYSGDVAARGEFHHVFDQAPRLGAELEFFEGTPKQRGAGLRSDAFDGFPNIRIAVLSIRTSPSSRVLLSGLDTVFKTVPTEHFSRPVQETAARLQGYERGLATNESDLVDGQSRLAREATVRCRFRPPTRWNRDRKMPRLPPIGSRCPGEFLLRRARILYQRLADMLNGGRAAGERSSRKPLKSGKNLAYSTIDSRGKVLW